MIVAFELACQQGVDRAEDLKVMEPLHLTYIASGCLGADYSKIPSLEPGQFVTIEVI